MDNETYSLFDDPAFDGSNKPHKNGLRIVAWRKKTLSKNQLAFNKLTARIERLQEAIKSETAKLEHILKVHAAEIPERKQALAKTRLALAKALGNASETIKYGKRLREHVRAAILHLCDRRSRMSNLTRKPKRFMIHGRNRATVKSFKIKAQ